MATPEFFTVEDLHLLKDWADLPYDKTNQEHTQVGVKLRDTVWEKTDYWAKEIVERLDGFKKGNKMRMWLAKNWVGNKGSKVLSAKFKPYSWSRIYKVGSDKNVFFSVGALHKPNCLFVNIDCYRESGTTLNESQIRICDTYTPRNLKSAFITVDNLHGYNWPKLINESVNLIRDNIHVYDNIVSVVFGNKPLEIQKFQNTLIKRNIPEGGIGGNMPIESGRRRQPGTSSEGDNPDWEGMERQAREIGKIGEELVIDYERMLLKDFPDLVTKIKKVDDINGYDIISCNKNGSPKYIEVKTTLGGPNASFLITENERKFSRDNKSSYVLYRLFNLDKNLRHAQFYEFPGFIDNHFDFKPMKFASYKKKRNNN